MGSGPGLNLRYFCPLCLPVGGSGAASGENNTLEKPSNEMILTVSQLFVLNFTLGMSLNININNTFIIFHLTLILTLKLKIQRCKVRQIG